LRRSRSRTSLGNWPEGVGMTIRVQPGGGSRRRSVQVVDNAGGAAPGVDGESPWGLGGVLVVPTVPVCPAEAQARRWEVEASDVDCSAIVPRQIVPP
jgi:hypothetical protein